MSWRRLGMPRRVCQRSPLRSRFQRNRSCMPSQRLPRTSQAHTRRYRRRADTLRDRQPGHCLQGQLEVFEPLDRRMLPKQAKEVFDFILGRSRERAPPCEALAWSAPVGLRQVPAVATVPDRYYREEKAGNDYDGYVGHQPTSLSYSPCVPTQNQCTPPDTGRPSAR